MYNKASHTSIRYQYLLSGNIYHTRYCALFPGSHLCVPFSRYLFIYFSIFLSSISVFVVLSIFTFRYSCFHFLLIFFVSISLMLTLYFLFILSMCCSHLLLLCHVCFISLFWSIFIYSHMAIQLFYFCYCLDIEDACFDCYCIITVLIHSRLYPCFMGC